MSNNNTHSVLFELQKNLEELSSAKEQVDFFRDKSLEITNGISEVQRKYVEHLQSIKTDYQNRVNDLKLELASFLSKTEDENFKAIQKVVDKSEETIGKGIEKFETVAQKVESSNNEKIEAINSLLEHYRSVVEASNSLIETLTAIDFPAKLDALSSKSQLIIESITSSRQALEIKLNEVQNSVFDKTNTAKDLVIQSNVNGINLLIEKITLSERKLSDSIINNLTQISIEIKSRFNNLEIGIKELSEINSKNFNSLNSILNEHIFETREHLMKQSKELKLLKVLLIIVIVLLVFGVMYNFLNFD